MMPLQRACAGESQVRNKLSNGPLRVQSKVPVILPEPSILQRGHTSVAGDMLVSSAGRMVNHEHPRWHRGLFVPFYFRTQFVLDRNCRFRQGRFLFLLTKSLSKIFL